MVLGYSKIREGFKTMEKKAEVESIVREIKRRSRKKYSSEEKIRIVLYRRDKSIWKHWDFIFSIIARICSGNKFRKDFS